MSNYDASKLDRSSVQCAVCEKTITGGKWFARVTHGEWTVALCCPLCAAAFEGNAHAYVRRIETIEWMRSRSAAQPDSPLKG